MSGLIRPKSNRNRLPGCGRALFGAADITPSWPPTSSGLTRPVSTSSAHCASAEAPLYWFTGVSAVAFPRGVGISALEASPHHARTRCPPSAASSCTNTRALSALGSWRVAVNTPPVHSCSRCRFNLFQQSASSHPVYSSTVCGGVPCSGGMLPAPHWLSVPYTSMPAADSVPCSQSLMLSGSTRARVAADGSGIICGVCGGGGGGGVKGGRGGICGNYAPGLLGTNPYIKTECIHRS